MIDYFHNSVSYEDESYLAESENISRIICIFFAQNSLNHHSEMKQTVEWQILNSKAKLFTCIWILQKEEPVWMHFAYEESGVAGC